MNKIHIYILMFTLILCVIQFNYVQAGDNLDSMTKSSPAKASIPGNVKLSMSFKSKIDGSKQPFIAKTPKGYSPQKKWPLFVMLHGYGAPPLVVNQMDSMIQIGPLGRGSVSYCGIGREDVFECIEMAKEIFSVDDDRIYLSGFSMGASATFELGLLYPDRWAACLPICGRCDNMNIVKNGLHIPYWIHAGGKDMRVSSKYSKAAYEYASDIAYEHWQYTEHPDMGHAIAINWKEVEKWLLTQKRVKKPAKVDFATKDYHANRAYWVKITGIKEYGQSARINAEIKEQEIYITIKNITNYTLDLENAPIDTSQAIKIIENGNVLFSKKLGNRYCRVSRPGKGLCKKEEQCGPFWDIYSDTCLLVCGTQSQDKELIQAGQECADHFRHPEWMGKVMFKTITDKKVTKQDLENNNLVLFGNKDTNSIIAKVHQKMPFQLDGDRVLFEQKSISADHIGYFVIYPSPYNSKKYIAIISGNSIKTINCFNKIWPQLNSIPRNYDAAIFEISGDGQVRWLHKIVFGSKWTLES